MSVDTPEDLRGLRRAGALVAETIARLAEAARPGVTTAALDALAAELFAERGARSGPVLTYRYPGHVCLSVDDEIVHGVPGPRVLADGQLLTIDVALELDGYHADAATTIVVGSAPPSARDRRMLAATRAALSAGIRAARPGSRVSDIGEAVERVVEARGFRIVPELTGHGIGRAMHEPPTIYNYPAAPADETLTDGLVFTIEPMVVAGSPRFRVDADGWTLRTDDGGHAAHEEHTVVVRDGGALVLTR